MHLDIFLHHPLLPSRFSTLRLSFLGPPEGCTPRTPFGGRVETQRALLRHCSKTADSVSRKGGKKCVDNEADLVEKEEDFYVVIEVPDHVYV